MVFWLDDDYEKIDKNEVMRTNNEMALKTNTVDLNTTALELGNQVQSSGGLVAWRLNVVVVVVQLDLEAVLLDHSLGSRERHWDVLGTDCVVPIMMDRMVSKCLKQGSRDGRSQSAA